MTGRLSGAYWKLWHDARGRFFLALALVLLALMGVFSTGTLSTPRPCNFANTNLSWSVMRGELKADMDLNQVELNKLAARGRSVGALPFAIRFPSWAAGYRDIGIPGPAQLADADVLARHCGDDERPDLFYAARVQLYTRSSLDAVRGGMTYIFLFIGILLSVGPPFSGESMEAFSLTFSLPWSRERWLISRIAVSVAMMIVLLAITAGVTAMKTHFPYMSQMHGGYPMNEMSREIAASAPRFAALLAGLVGIALGTAASLFSRNVLTAAVSASLIAYVLIGINFDVPTGLGSFIPLPIIVNGNAIVAALVIGIAGLVISTRLRTTDF